MKKSINMLSSLLIIALTGCSTEVIKIDSHEKPEYLFYDLKKDHVFKKPDFVVINENAIKNMPKKVILFPFFVKAEEAQIVLRDQLQPFFVEELKKGLNIDEFVTPDQVGVKSIKDKINYHEVAQGLLKVYAQQSVVDTKNLNVLLDHIDNSADGIIFIQVKTWECSGNNASLNVRGYFFIRNQTQAAWVAEGNFKDRVPFNTKYGFYNTHENIPGVLKNITVDTSEIPYSDTDSRRMGCFVSVGISELLLYVLTDDNSFSAKNVKNIKGTIDLKQNNNIDAFMQDKYNNNKLIYNMEDGSKIEIFSSYVNIIYGEKTKKFGYYQNTYSLRGMVDGPSASPQTNSYPVLNYGAPFWISDKITNYVPSCKCTQEGYHLAGITLLVEFVASMPFTKQK
jgi:hypothetical protein